MKLIQVNAWCGRLNGPLARFIADEQPDILCIQEAFKPKDGLKPILGDQFNFVEEIKTVGNFEHEFFSPSWGFKLGDGIMDAGIIILSRFPLSQEERFHTFNDYFVIGEGATYKPNTRSCQTCVATLTDGKMLSLLNYHGYLDGPFETGTEITVETMQKVYDAAAKLPHPLIMCGDFNAWPSSPAIKLLDGLGLTNLTIKNGLTHTLSEVHHAPAGDRARAISDYILVSPGVTVQNFSMSEQVVSDHDALILEFEV